MPFTRPSLTGLQQQAISDIVNAGLPGGVTGNVLPQSVLRALAYGQAGLSYGHYAFLDWIAKQSVPYTSSGEFLEGWSALKGVLREAATGSTGFVQFTGTDGAIIPAGSVVQRADGVEYSLDDDITIVAALGIGPITALTVGEITNCGQGIPLTLQLTIVGVQSQALAASALVGGADMETDDQLRTRMLYAYSSQPTGGSASDYVTWATQVEGCTRAWATSNVPGEVTVFTMWDEVNSAVGGFPIGTDGASTYETRYPPATGDQLLIADHIFYLRPVTALVISVAPTPFPIDLTILDLANNTQAVRAGIEESVSRQLLRIGNPLGMVVYQSQMTESILAVPNVLHFDLTMPVEIVVPYASMPTLGTITYV